LITIVRPNLPGLLAAAMRPPPETASAQTAPDRFDADANGIVRTIEQQADSRLLEE
jgi:hypothetical protein